MELDALLLSDVFKKMSIIQEREMILICAFFVRHNF